MNSISTKILFWIYRSKVNSKGLAPIYLRLTQDGKKSETSTGLFIPPKHWDSRKNRVKGISPNHVALNERLESLKAAILQQETKAVRSGRRASILDLKASLGSQDQQGFMHYYREHNNRIEKLIGNQYSKNTFLLYERTRQQFQDYLMKSFNRTDISLSQLDFSTIQGFSDYLRVILKNDTNTIYKKLQRVCQIVHYLIKRGKLARNPFIDFRLKKERKEIIYLDSEELSRLENKTITIPRLGVIKDLFVFSCYTGLAYHESFSLTNSAIVEDNGVSWIRIIRQKTGKMQEIPLLRQAKELLAKYRSNTSSKIFPCPSNQKVNAYLKEIADVCSINKRLTFHVARKTFATTVTLTKGVPLETVSKLLGHSSIAMTQGFYAVVNREKVLADFFGACREGE